MDATLLAEARDHDRAVARCAGSLWIGAEPTFTDRTSFDPWWLSRAEGGDKEIRARALLVALAPRLAGAVRLLRAKGRLYPGEEAPRFCLGALFRRAGVHQGVREDALEGPIVDAPERGDGEAWLSVTSDPGVVEVNLAPASDLAMFAGWAEAVYAAAAESDLSPVRYGYSGDETDSGGGGQLTLGGPTPERSPFILQPQLVPRLVRYLNRHPSLSYAFGPGWGGSASQGPRPDEGVRECFEELPVALGRLAARGDAVTPEELWSTLAPLLVDPSGNSHRAELNVEKLWNAGFSRGRLGLVELRALRMPTRAARLTAIAALFRAVAARLAAAPYDEPLVDWGSQLHERFGLPWYQRRDLEEVLAELDAHGLGLGPALRAEVLSGPDPIAAVTLGGAALEVAPALSFWPLVGDVASQEWSGARLVDASSARVQLLVTAEDGSGPGTLTAQGWRVPLRALPGGGHVGSVLYRRFVPQPGLHPGLPAQDPLILRWARGGECVQVALHGWAPGGAAYAGLPADAGEALRRRRERVLVTPAADDEVRTSGATGLCLDVRREGSPGLQPPLLEF